MESAFSIQVTIFFSRYVKESVTIVPRVIRILILVPLHCLLPPILLEDLLWASIGPMTQGGGPTVGAREVWAVSLNVTHVTLFAMQGRGSGINGSRFNGFW